MRNDVVIDRKQVNVPKASTLGFGKFRAQFGDMIMYHDQEATRVGRIIGRVQSAPSIGQDGPLRDHLVVAVFSDDLTFIYERWVDPASVARCWTPQPKHRELWQFMLGDEFKKRSPDELREWAESGFSTWETFQEYKRNR